MSEAPGARIEIASLPNLRDLGGWPTADGGRVRRGLLYRSVALDKLDEPGTAAVTRLGIRTVIDLRTEGERTAEPDRLPDGRGATSRAGPLHDRQGPHRLGGRGDDDAVPRPRRGRHAGRPPHPTTSSCSR
jgi:hypothetical protein